MEDGPRYHTVNVGLGENLQVVLRGFMRPGDRIVSVYPVEIQQSLFNVRLVALLELRHPSWAKEGVGWVPGDEAPEL